MIKVQVAKHLFTCFLILFVATCCFGQAEKAESDIAVIMKKLDVVGLSVAVVKEGKLIYTHSFGLKNIENNSLLTNKDFLPG